MTIRAFFDGQPYDSEVIRGMSRALAGACQALGWFVGDDPATRLVAERVIEIARHGERDSDRLKEAVLKSFKT